MIIAIIVSNFSGHFCAYSFQSTMQRKCGRATRDVVLLRGRLKIGKNIFSRRDSMIPQFLAYERRSDMSISEEKLPSNWPS